MEESPKPKKLNADSIKIAVACVNDIFTIIVVIVFGTNSEKIILKSDAPEAIAALQYGLSFNDNISALTSLDVCGQDNIEITIIILIIFAPNIATSTKAKKLEESLKTSR